MWWAGSRLDLYLGLKRCLAMDGAGVLLDATCVSPADGLAALASCLGRQPARRPACLWLSGALCRPFVLAGLKSFRSADEVDTAAAAMGGAALDADDVRCWLQPPGRGAETCLGVVAAEALAALAEQTLKPRIRGRLRLSPWWAEATRLPVGEDAWLVIEEGDSLTALQAQQGQVVSTRTAAPLEGEGAHQTLMRWRAAGHLPREGVAHLRLRATATPGGLSGQLALGAMADMA